MTKTVMFEGEAITLDEVIKLLDDALLKREESCRVIGSYIVGIVNEIERAKKYIERVDYLMRYEKALKYLQDVEGEAVEHETD